MSNRVKTKDQLKDEFDSKMIGLKSILESALKMEQESVVRIETSNTIASILRSILCGDINNSFISLVKRTDLDKRLLFPLYNASECLNVLTSYNLLGFSINSNTGTKVFINDDIFRSNSGHWVIYLTFESWINEVVIDTKLKEVEPLTRYDVIKAVADTRGAHVDNEIERHYFEMSKHELLPILYKDGEVIKHDLALQTKTLFCETILAIAQELILSYELFKNSSYSSIGPTDFNIRVQRYNINNKHFNDCVKYGTSPIDKKYSIHTYNSNSYYECEVFEKRANYYHIRRKNGAIKSVIIDYKNVLLNGTFVEKSIYPLDNNNEIG